VAFQRHVQRGKSLGAGLYRIPKDSRKQDIFRGLT
jgi:hypothetical protein